MQLVNNGCSDRISGISGVAIMKQIE